MGNHKCHWPNCPEEVQPAMFMCKPHWFTLPAKVRMSIWKTYRPGQELDKQPSQLYIEATKAVFEWIKENYGQ